MSKKIKIFKKIFFLIFSSIKKVKSMTTHPTSCLSSTTNTKISSSKKLKKIGKSIIQVFVGDGGHIEYPHKMSMENVRYFFILYLPKIIFLIFFTSGQSL